MTTDRMPELDDAAPALTAISVNRLAFMEEVANDASDGDGAGLSITNRDRPNRYSVGVGPGGDPVLATFTGDNAHADAWLFFTARDHILSLLTAYRAMRAERDRYREALEKIEAHGCDTAHGCDYDQVTASHALYGAATLPGAPAGA